MAKREEINGIEIHSEEVQDILGPIPGRLLNWGALIMFSLFLIIVAGSYFFTFSEVVSAPMIITTSNPPAPLICNVSGRIDHWFVRDGELVKKGDKVALISNSANFGDILILEKLIDSLRTSSLVMQVVEYRWPKYQALGEIQSFYTQFAKTLEDYKSYRTEHIIDRKIDLLRQEKKRQEENYQLLMDQKKLQETDLDIAERKYDRYGTLMEKGGVSDAELDNAKSQLLQTRRSYLSFLSSLKANEINMISQERSIVELNEQDKNNIAQFERTIEENIDLLKKAILDWKTKYLVTSPTIGKVTFTRFWSENHVVGAGERLATVVPSDGTTIICRAKVPSASIGKVEMGQKVNLKLSGFPFMQYGMLSGVVSAISLVPENNEYIVEVMLEGGMTSNYREQLKLVQEMEGTAEIITRKTRMINRFINPLKAIEN